jgi:hypothetical protein
MHSTLVISYQEKMVAVEVLDLMLRCPLLPEKYPVNCSIL